MEEVFVEVRVREDLVNDSQLRTTVSAIRYARGFDGDGAKPHSFFSPENNAGGDTRRQT
jgi:hypothetical protein